MRATFPTLLTHKARIIGGLTRIDLIALAISYFVLSLFSVGGISQLFIMALGMFLLKHIQKLLAPGFFRFIGSKRQISWGHQLGGTEPQERQATSVPKDCPRARSVCLSTVNGGGKK